jgi:hypothetical protein
MHVEVALRLRTGTFCTPLQMPGSAKRREFCTSCQKRSEGSYSHSIAIFGTGSSLRWRYLSTRSRRRLVNGSDSQLCIKKGKGGYDYEQRSRHMQPITNQKSCHTSQKGS